MELLEGYEWLGNPTEQVMAPNGYPTSNMDDRRYFCMCGCFKFEVFSPQPYYTVLHCVSCDRETEVHVG